MEEITIYYFLIYLISYFGLFTTLFFFMTLFEYKKNIKDDPEVDLKDPKLPSATIIIPAFNEEKAIARTIESVLQLNYPKNKLEIMIIDDGSTDNTYAEAKKMAIKNPHIKVFRKENGGKGQALNFGIARAKNELIISLDADSFVSKDALKKMVGYFKDSKVMAVTPSMTIFEPKGFFQNLQYAEYTLGIFLKKIFGLMNCIHVTPGPFSVYRKWFFDKYGGYETNNLTEDIEIALRIQKYGYKIENSISSLVYTIAPNTFMGLLKQRIRWYYGFTQNVLNYKELFNPKYGYLAVLMLPIAFISVLFSILIFLYFVYQNIHYFIDRIVQFSVIGNSLFIVEFKNFKLSYLWDSFVNTFTNPLILIVLVSVVFTLSILIIAKKKSGDKRNMILATIYFFFTYWFFYALWWIYAFVYKGLGGKIGWGKRKH